MTKRTKERALLIIDVQNDFCPGGSLAVDRGDEVISVINGLIPCFPHAIATQDWHPADHVSFASSHPGKKILDTIVVDGITQVLWPGHCVQGSRGAELHPRLDVRGIGLVLRKGARSNLDSYSAFFENDRRTETGLRYYLKGFKVREVFVCGLATDYCVFFSAMDARRIGFTVFLVSDACRGVDLPRGNVGKALEEMGRAGVRMIQSKDIV